MYKKLLPKDMTFAEQNAMTEMRAGIMWSQPFFAHILMDKCEMIPTRDIPKNSDGRENAGSTDGRKIFINPAVMAEWDLNQRVYFIAHEVMHVVLEHIEQGYLQRNGIVGPTGLMEADHDLINIVQDWSINALLDESKVGERPPFGSFNDRVKGGESWVALYAEEYAKRKKDGNNPGDKSGNGPSDKSGNGSSKPNNQKGFDEHLEPGEGTPDKTPAQAIQERNDTRNEMRQAVAEAMEIAKARGSMPAGLQRLVDGLVEVQVDWKEKLACMVVKHLGGGSLDWNMPELPLMAFVEPVYMASRAGTGSGTIVIARDTSGSIGKQELKVFGGCMAGIFEQAQPERAIVMDCDAYVHQTIELEDPTDIDALDMSRNAKGGGGTSFVPVFDALKRMEVHPDCLVYLTDGYGNAPNQAPSYQVIWAIIPGGRNSCAWGDTVEIKL